MAKKHMQTKIQILDTNHNLENYLLSVKNKKIDIVVAFASKTEDLIKNIVNNGNRVTLTIGTINYFSDPAFIKECRMFAKKNQARIDFYVDFRVDNSLHWKVYLISPDTVIIGSANLTSVGVSMTRDTAVVISDKSLYKTYHTIFSVIRKNEYVISHNNTRFGKFLLDYEEKHRKVIVRSLNITDKKYKSKTVTSFSGWLSQDKTQGLPIFIWDADLTHKDLKEFRKTIKPTIDLPSANTRKLDLLGYCYGVKKNKPYHDGDLILEMNSKGGYIRFMKTDLVVYGNGKWWLCAQKGSHMATPFVLTSELKAAIKQKVDIWFSDDRNFLNSNDLRELNAFQQS